MGELTCPRCDTIWQQAGNRTGHCSACHRTFSGLAAFDGHQTIERGTVTCHDPATLRDRHGAPRWKATVDTAGATVWHSAREFPEELKRR